MLAGITDPSYNAAM